MNATMTKKLLVGSCALLFCLLVLLPSPVEASRRKDQQTDNLLANNPKRRQETTTGTFQPHEPKPFDPQPKIETPQTPETHHTDGTEGDDSLVQFVGATVICFFLSVGWQLWKWPNWTFSAAPPAIPNSEEQETAEGDQDQVNEDPEDQEQKHEDQEPEDQVKQEPEKSVHEDNSINTLPSPPSSPSAAYLFSPSRSTSSSSSSSSSLSSPARSLADLQPELLLQDLQERELEPFHPEFRNMFKTLYHLMTSIREEMAERMDSMHAGIQEVKGTTNRVEDGVEKSKAMQADSRSNQRKAEHDRKIKAFDRIRFSALSWWMVSILITGAFLLWGNESGTFNFDYWTIVVFVVATVPSFFLGFKISSGLFFVALFLIWANSSAVLFVAFRTTLTSFVQLAIFYGLSSVTVGHYLQKKFDVVRNERFYKVFLILGFICLGIALGWISMFIPAFWWETFIVKWCDSHIPTLPQTVGPILQSVGSITTALLGSLVSVPSSFLSYFWSFQTSPFVSQ